MNEQLIKTIINVIDQHKGEEINVLNIAEISNFADYFVIASAINPLHCQALSNYIIEEVRKVFDQKPLHIEGSKTGEWILLDYGDIIIHLFNREQREFYQLDRLWGDAEKFELN